MRDPKRIKSFCNWLANEWEDSCPDWRFGQLIINVFSTLQIDPFFIEEDEMRHLIYEYFHPDFSDQTKEEVQ